MSILIEKNSIPQHDWGRLLKALKETNDEIVITENNEPVATILSYEDFLTIRDFLRLIREQHFDKLALRESAATMLASERVLAREWLLQEEDDAWADL